MKDFSKETFEKVTECCDRIDDLLKHRVFAVSSLPLELAKLRYDLLDCNIKVLVDEEACKRMLKIIDGINSSLDML